MTRTFWYWRGWTIHAPTKTGWVRVAGEPGWVLRTDVEGRRGLVRYARLAPALRGAIGYPNTWQDLEALPLPINLGSEAHPKWSVIS
jgi:hypothetical protein